MRLKILAGVLGAEALLCILLFSLQSSFAGVFTAVMAFPFEQIGFGLRVLSLSGDFGNAVSIVIYIVIGLLPAAGFLFMSIKRKARIEDGLLVLLSVVLFAVLYLMINPSIIDVFMGGTAGRSVGKAAYGGIVYSVLCGYFILKILRIVSAGGTEKLIRYMSVMLGLLSIIFVYMIFGILYGSLLDSIAVVKTGNTGSIINSINVYPTGFLYIFLILQFIADALPYALNILIIFAGIQLLEEMQVNRYSTETVTAAKRVSRLCTKALAAIILVNIGFNLIPLILAAPLRIIHVSVQIPVFPITFVLAALLLTKLVAENKELKDDNDMFI